MQYSTNFVSYVLCIYSFFKKIKRKQIFLDDGNIDDFIFAINLHISAFSSPYYKQMLFFIIRKKRMI